MTLHNVEELTGMSCREFPEATTEWMRCQIGEWQVKPIRTGRFKESLEKVFSVRAFGETWEKALDMFDSSKHPQVL